MFLIISSIPYVAALALVVLELTGRLRRRPLRVPAWPAPVWIAVLIASYVAQIGIYRYAALHSDPMPPWAASLPIPIVQIGTMPQNDWPFRSIAHWDLVAAGVLALSIVQSYALAGLYRAGVSRAALACGCVLILGISLAAPVLTSADLYGYVRDALLGLSGYSTAGSPLAGEYAVIARLRLPGPTTYGPLWLALASIMTAGGSLAVKLVVYRLFSAAAFLALLASLRAYGIPRRLLALVALNPAMAWQFVANGHNDVLVAAIVVLAAVLVRTQTIVAAALVVVAGLLKLPYAALALPIFWPVAPVKRFVICAAVIIAVIAISAVGGGTAYFHALQSQTGYYPALDLVRIAPLIAAAAALAAAIASRRRLVTGVWLMPMIAGFRLPWVFPWYLAFGMPYALARRAALRYLFVAFPIVATLLTAELLRPWMLLAAFPVAVALSMRPPERQRA